MFHDISWPAAGLLTAWCTALIYGMNVVMSAGCVQILISRGFRNADNRALFVIVTLQFAMATVHLAFSVQQAMDGFLKSPDATAYFVDQGTPAHVAQTALYITNNLVADGVLIWRTYVVWNKNIRLCIPIAIMAITSAACGYVDVAQLASMSSAELLFSLSVRRWALSTWSLSIATQLSATLLIAWKVWYTHVGAVGPHKTQRTMVVVWIVLESGAVLSLAYLFQLVLYARRAVAGAVVISMAGQLDTLIPTSMLVRVATTDKLHHEANDPRSRSRPWTGVHPGHRVSLGTNYTSSAFGNGKNMYEMKKVLTPDLRSSSSSEDQV